MPARKEIHCSKEALLFFYLIKPFCFNSFNLTVISSFAFHYNLGSFKDSLLILIIRKNFPGSFFHLSGNHLTVFSLFFKPHNYTGIAFCIPVLT